jgi:hypothetical protein
MFIPHQRGTIDPSRSSEGDSGQPGFLPKLAKPLADVGFPDWQLAGAGHTFSLPEGSQKKHEILLAWEQTCLLLCLPMACHTTKKRRYRTRPGAVKAALELGVTYSHLRRVLAGERPSKRLLARYKSLKAEGSNARRVVKNL